MPSTLDKTKVKGLFALLKGESGEGKSVAALSFPKPYVFDFDRKMPAISNKHFPGKEVHWDTFEDIFAVSDKIAEFMMNGCPYETLIFDSITTLSTLCLNTLAKQKGEDPVKQIKLVNARDKKLEVMGFDYYNAETNFIDRYLLENAQILHAREGNPKHVLFLAHIVTVESAPDIRTKLVTKTRSIVTAGRKSAAYIPTKFDEVYMFGHKDPDPFEQRPAYKKTRRIVMTELSGDDSAKTAYTFPGEIDFTDSSFYDILTNYTSFEEEK